jgi:hypothetical protein
VFPGVRYIAVPEFGKKGTKRLHLHLLVWNLPEEIIYYERANRTIANMWGGGFVDLFKTDGSFKLAGYLAKYLSKALSDNRLLGQKSYVTSRNVSRPTYSNSELMLSYLSDSWELSTLNPVQCKSYDTMWLGRCNKTTYELEENNIKNNMKVVICSKENISSKKGVDYVKMGFLSSTGVPGEIFTTKEKYDAFNFDEKKIMDRDALKSIFEGVDNVDVEFDQKGYLTGIK